MIETQQPTVVDVAASLCVLGGGGSRDTHHLVSPTPNMDCPPSLPGMTGIAPEPPSVLQHPSISANLILDFHVAVPAIGTTQVKAVSPKSKKQGKTRSKYTKRLHPVSLDEMKRLMRVYGPIKCLRNRNHTRLGSKNKKDTSIKRKFYRWFPDFNERFEMTEGGWFMPKYGHEHEMEYREAMRRSDQRILTKKRSAKRCGPKSFDVPASASRNDNTVSIPL